MIVPVTGVVDGLGLALVEAGLAGGVELAAAFLLLELHAVAVSATAAIATTPAVRTEYFMKRHFLCG
jgi:hypothetical protein